ncbi:MAG: LysR family transcriptional regulator, partial [Myxococcales bacterium]
MSSTHNGPALHRIDLNLLVALDALTRERSVTRAAERVGVTQSAMSHTLRRLRELFGDPLLVRGRGGMVLTPRAEALAVPLRSGLVSLARILAEPEAFAPERASRIFRIVSPDLFDALV